MRRVLLTCEDYFPVIGGAEVCVHNIKKELELLGYVVTLYTNTIDPTPEGDASIVRIAWKFRPGQLWRNITTLWKLIGEVDLVHCQYSFRLACLCAILCKIRRKPMLLTQQGRGIVPEVNPKLHHAILYTMCQHISMKGASLITSTSDEITDLTAKFVSRSKIIGVTNGFDTHTFKPDASLPLPKEYREKGEHKKRILTVRRLVPKNGIHIFVQALALVKENYPNFHYFAVGEGRSQKFIEELIQEFELQDHVTLLGKRGNDTLVSYYQHADLICVPSSAEATSIACIEAMGMARPLIASRVGGMIDLLGKNSEYGTLVKIYNSEDCDYNAPERLPRERLKPLADAIVDVLKNPDSHLLKAKKACSLAQSQYSWAGITKSYIALYDRLLTP